MALVTSDELVTILAQTKDHKYFDALVQNEPGINWLAFATKLYRTSNSVGTVITYSKGICVFRAMCDGKKISAVIESMKADEDFLYSVLDDFVTYCSVTRNFSARVTRLYFATLKKLLGFCGIDLNDNKLSDIELPTAQDVPDEYPDNELIKRIDSACSLVVRGWRQVINDTGFEPVDAAKLKVKDVRFDEAIPRITKNREKTGHRLEGFLSTVTAETLKAIISAKQKQPDDYIFTSSFSSRTVQSLRDGYNLALARAGLGTFSRIDRHYKVKVAKIDGHNFGKYHVKIYKKRWFTLAVGVVPDYVAQAMLGRGAYLKQYFIQPLDKRQEYARKILQAVAVYHDKANKQEVINKTAEILGVDPSMLDETKLQAFKGLMSQFAALPADKLGEISKILGTGTNAHVSEAT